MVETTTTKKTALKILSALGTSEESTKVASTIGTAPRKAGPTEQQPLARSEVAERCGDPHGGGSDHRARAAPPAPARRGPPAGSSLREHEETQDDEQDDLGDEGEPFVEGDELLAVAGGRAAYGEPDQVDGEEAAAAHHVGGAERHRRHRQ